MLVEEGTDGRLHHVRVELGAAVARAGDLVERDVAFRPLQCLVEQFALMDGHEGVLIPVDDQEGRCLLGHVFDGVSTPHLVDVFLDRAADQSRFGRRGWVVFQCVPGTAWASICRKSVGPRSTTARTRLD